LLGAGLVADAVVIATTGGDVTGVEFERAENRHHPTASSTAAAAPTRTGMSGDRRWAVCSAVAALAGSGLDADTSFAVGIIFCPVSGDESDFTGTPVIDAIT
jgi:hypothetical protein